MTETRTPVFIAVCTLTTCLALSLVSLRIIYRFRNKILMAADYMILIAMMFSLIHYTLDMITVSKFGYGLHESDLPPDLQNSYKTKILYWLMYICTKPPLLFAKLSLCLVYRGILSRADTRIVRISRVLNYITMTIVVGFFSPATLTTIFGCVPIQKNWYPKLDGTCVNSTSTLNYVIAAVNIVTSLLLIYIPLPVLFEARELRIEIKQLIALILLGLVDTIISGVRAWSITLLWNINTDFTWIAVPVSIIVVVEFNMTIVAASLVVMRNCFQDIHNFFFPSSRYSTKKSKSDYSGGDSYPSYAGTSSAYSDPNDARKQKGVTGIFRTVDVQLDTRSVSTEEILGRHVCV